MPTWDEIKPRLKPVESAPALKRVNGIGVGLLGWKREIPGSPMYFKGYWITVLFFPLIPLGFYVVSGGYPEYRFHARMSLWDFVVIYKWSSVIYILSAFLESVVLFVVFFGLMFAVLGGLHWAFSFFR